MSLFAELRRRNVFRVAIAYGVVSWLAIQIADVMIDNIGAPDWLFRTLLLVIAIGFPIALVLAWAFELTPQGIRREEDVDRDVSISPETGRRLDRGIIVLLALVVGWFLLDEFVLEPREAAAPPTAVNAAGETGGASPSEGMLAPKSIAVLPFADLSQGQDQTWFADGLAEEILNTLARAPDLLVTARTASFAYRDSTESLQTIAGELGVEHILEGSVRRAGDRLRVTAQLVRAGDGFQLWSQNYDRGEQDVIALQEALALAIARALKTTMDPEALARMVSAGTRNVEAYELYLNGLAQRAEGFATAQWQLLEAAYNAFERARALDPGFSSAHAYAAFYWRWELSILRRDVADIDLSLEEKMALFRERIEAAIATAPNPIDRQRHEILLAAAEMRVRDMMRLARNILEERPYDVDTLDEYANAAVWASDREVLAEISERALALDDLGVPLANDLYISRSWRIVDPLLEDENHRQQFIDNTMRLVQADPSAHIAYQAHRALLFLGETALARSLLPLLRNDEEGRVLIDARQACAEGRRADTEALLAALPETYRGEDLATREWHLHMMLGQEEAAVASIKPYESMATPLALGAYLVYPQFDPEPFPVVMSIIERENIVRPPPRMPAFQCPPPGSDRPTVAVLPFASLSSGADDGYFADGLTEEILNALAQVPELQVTARTSSFHFKGRNLPIPDIASQLGVEHVVEGSVRRSGEQVRITAQLIRASDGFHLWSNTYDRTLEDIFAVQEDIARNIVETLDIVLDEEKLAIMRRSGIGDINTFIAFQKGRELFVAAHDSHDLSDIEGSVAAATPYFEQTLAVAPGLTAAWLYMADEPAHAVFNMAAGQRGERYQGEAEQKLQEIKRQLDSAWEYARPGPQRAILDVERTLFQDDWSALPARIQQALQQSDCPRDNWMTEVATILSTPEAVLPYVKAKHRCDPLSGLVTFNHAYTQLWAGNPTESLRLIENAQKRGIAFGWLDGLEFISHLALGNFEHPSMNGTEPIGWYPYDRETVRSAAQGDLDQALNLADAEYRKATSDDWTSLLLAAMVGDRERANHLAATIDARPGGFLAMNNATYACLCGSPFDLEATPNFAMRLAEAGIIWSPRTVIRFPGKDW